MTNEPITGAVYGEEAARQRTRDFLLREAEKPLADLLTSVESALEAFVRSLDGVSPAQAAFAPGGEGEDAFSIEQVARHVAGSGDIMASRLLAIGSGERPARATSPGNFGDVEAGSLAAMAAPLQQVRDALRASVAALEGRERLDSLTPHPMFGELNCRAYLRLIGLHFADHAHQVTRIKADSRYPGH